MTETVCPLCGVPRPPGAKQCICNYTFEYDKLHASGPSDSARAKTPRDAAVDRGLIVAAVVVAVWFHGSGAQDERSRPELGFFLIAGGVFAVCGGVFAWDFFMSHRRARFLSFFLGRTGTRYLYGVLGGAFVGMGVAMALL
jgi:hypothetical protein